MYRLSLSALFAAGLLAGVTLSMPRPVVAQAQGIKVHGHWVIEVRNADGTLKEKREFENALKPGGQGTLTQLLARTRAMGIWRVVVTSTSNSSIMIDEPGSPDNAGPTLFKNLTLSGKSETSLVLQGSFVAGDNGDVQQVETRTLTGAAWIPFSATALPAVVPVQTGQTVSVTVTISFS